MSTTDNVTAQAAAILARLNPPSVQPSTVLKPAPPKQPSMSATEARAIMAKEGVPNADESPTGFDWMPVSRGVREAVPRPQQDPPTRWQKFAAWMNTPIYLMRKRK